MPRWRAFVAAPVLICIFWAAPAGRSAAGQTPEKTGADYMEPGWKDTPNPPQPVAEPCAATIAESEGIVRLSLSDAARAGKKLTVEVDDFGDESPLNYDARFDPTGKLTLEAPLFHDNPSVRWEGADGKTCQKSVRFEGYDHAFRAALVWSGPAILALHVIEPTGAIGAASHYVSPSRPNRALDPSSYGYLREFGDHDANLHVQLYAVPSGQNPRDGSPVGFRVENVSRGNPATPPFCGADPLAHIVYHMIFQQNGQAPKMTNRGFAPVACGFSWKDKERSFSPALDMRM